MQIRHEQSVIQLSFRWFAPCMLAILSIAPSITLAKTKEQPNIVLLISDDDDYEHFGFMGSEIAYKPGLDKLAASGTLFTTAYCPAAVGRPSLTSILSGRLPHQHGIYSNQLVRRALGKDTITPDRSRSLANRERRRF